VSRRSESGCVLLLGVQHMLLVQVLLVGDGGGHCLLLLLLQHRSVRRR
jgi:hypothetical protein